MTPSTPHIRTLAILFLLAQGTATLIWWATLLLYPPTHHIFFPAATPTSIILALLLPDLVPYAGCSLLSAYALARRRLWAHPILCLHAGAAAYAALFAISLPLLNNGDGTLGALLMLPSLILPPLFTWLLRPQD